MSGFMAKMHEVRCPRESLQRSPDPPAVRGPIFKESEGEEVGEEGGGKGKGGRRERRGGARPPKNNFGLEPPLFGGRVHGIKEWL